MKVQDLINRLSQMDNEAHICALVYSKEEFDFEEDDDLTLTNDGWEKLCNDFDEMRFADIYESVWHGVIDVAQMK